MRASRKYIRLATRVRDTFGAVRTVTRIASASVNLDRGVRVTWEELEEAYTLHQFTLPAGTRWVAETGEEGETLLDCEVQVLENGWLLSPLGTLVRVWSK